MPGTGGLSVNTIQKIKKIYIFEDLKDDELDQIYALAQRRNFMAGETIVFEGDEGDSCFLLIHGSVEVTKMDEESGEEEKIGRLASGSYFGEMALLGLYTRTATVTALEATEALEIEGKPLHDLFYDHPKIGMAFYRAMALGLVKRLRDTTDEVSYLKASMQASA